ncbi:MAG TPA: hypothetical protein VHO50_00485 [Bacteroidales bacterium]|nr:hypothetical protein [Bacteroidales bacterium]
MKKYLLSISSLLIMLIFIVSGCEKDDPKPAPVVSPGKEVVSFKVTSLNPVVTAVLDTTNKIITVTVPNNTNVTALAPEIVLAPGYSISPASGSAQNFTNPVSYTVTRPNNTTSTWTAKVNFPDMIVEDDITQSVTWTADRVYTINSSISINNSSVLTIEPGTIIRFGAEGSLEFGYGSNSTIIAQGTAQKPIIFTSSAALPTAGAWNGLYFYDKTLSNSVMEYCKILYAGKDAYDGAVNLYGCDITMKNCTIENSGSFGVLTTYSDMKGGFVDYSNNTINKTAKYALELNAMKISKLGAGNVFTDTKGIHIIGDFRSSNAETWLNHNVPYIVTDELGIDGSLTLAAGSVFKFSSGGSLSVGYYDQTVLTAIGTATAPITFTSSAATPAAGAWEGITMYDNTQTNTKMEYCVIDYAGSVSYNGSLDLRGTTHISLKSSTIRNSAGYGITLDAESGFQEFTGINMSACVNHLITISTKHLPDLGANNTLTASSNKGILVTGDANYTDPVTWKKQTANFYVDDESDIDGILTIEAGSNFLFTNDGFFWFGYYQNTKVTAVGTANSPIVFTSASASPAPATWRGLRFDALVQTNSSLDFCTIKYSGANSKPGIFTETSFNVSNTTISDFTGNAAEYSGTAPTGSGNNFTWTSGTY